MSERLTVVCAVWHRQRDLDLLLAQHRASVLGQTVPVRLIYVADGGLQLADDDPRVTVVHVDRGIRYAEALMAGLALADTEYYAACNVDDHWFTDAVEQQLDAMDAARLDLCGGDWEIRFAPEADVARPCGPLGSVAPATSWPPVPGPPQRLGNADGGGSFGPAPVFRTATVRRVGGYPRRFGDGTPVNTIMDYVLWDRIRQAGGRAARLPLILGTYFSDPGSQLEFRNGGSGAIAEEHRTYERTGALL